MFVLVELASDLVGARDLAAGVGEVARLRIDTEHDRQAHNAAHELDQVAVGEHTGVRVYVELEARVQLVATNACQVVALRIKEEGVEQLPRVVDCRRLARTLFLEDLDQCLVVRLGRILLERQVDEEVRLTRVGVAEQVANTLVRVGIERLARGRVDLGEGAQQRRDRQLALAVDACEDQTLLIDLELEPRTALWHQVRGEDLLRRILRLHDVRARRTHQLRYDDALGAVDDEGARSRHLREVAHKDPLFADLTRFLVDKRDRHEEARLKALVGLAALALRQCRRLEDVVTELHGKRAGVVLDRRNVVDDLANTCLHEFLEGGALDVDQVRDVKDARCRGLL